MKTRLEKLIGITTLLLCASTATMADQTTKRDQIERGKYIVATSGCNDCHTQGYPQSDGNVPEAEWLTGSPIGFQGPWGTSYPANLRLLMQNLTEKQWLVKARKPMLPPMPWFNLRDMNDADLLAIYAFVRAMGPAGKMAPKTGKPGELVNTPYYEFMPKNMLMKQASR